MNSVENTNMSNISMEELIAIGEYFSGKFPVMRSSLKRMLRSSWRILTSNVRGQRKSPL
jgi:hypothetical protein